eukprot:Hpha_TRINITY_DN7724_c0_g1::TRINITY_DN7724_c0_g1_i1::g.85534::m.85534
MGGKVVHRRNGVCCWRLSSRGRRHAGRVMGDGGVAPRWSDSVHPPTLVQLAWILSHLRRRALTSCATPSEPPPPSDPDEATNVPPFWYDLATDFPDPASCKGLSECHGRWFRESGACGAEGLVLAELETVLRAEGSAEAVTRSLCRDLAQVACGSGSDLDKLYDVWPLTSPAAADVLISCGMALEDAFAEGERVWRELRQGLVLPVLRGDWGEEAERLLLGLELPFGGPLAPRLRDALLFPPSSTAQAAAVAFANDSGCPTKARALRTVLAGAPVRAVDFAVHAFRFPGFAEWLEGVAVVAVRREADAMERGEVCLWRATHTAE